MLPFWENRKKNKENIGKIQLILDKLQQQNTFQEEQWSLQRENYQKLLTRQRKSETIIEDILQNLEEYRIAVEERNSIKEREKTLTGYVLNYDEGFHQIERMHCESEGEDSEWVKQLHKMREQLCGSMESSGLKIIKETGIPVDFTVHEVIGICETEQKEKNNRVCQVITPGAIFQGEVLNKARITVYQYKEDTF